MTAMRTDVTIPSGNDTLAAWLYLPGAGNGVTAGLAQYIEPLASAGVAAGVDAVFLEVHESPSRAKSDAANALRLDQLEPLIRKLKRIDAVARDVVVVTESRAGA